MYIDIHIDIYRYDDINVLYKLYYIKKRSEN